MFTNYSTTTTAPVSDMLYQRNDDDGEYIWLLKVSYLWYGVFGFVITFIVGYVVSFSLDLCNLGGSKKIYLDTKKRYIDTELFSPPVSKRLKKQNARYLERDSNVSILRSVVSLLKLFIYLRFRFVAVFQHKQIHQFAFLKFVQNELYESCAK